MKTGVIRTAPSHQQILGRSHSHHCNKPQQHCYYNYYYYYDYYYSYFYHTTGSSYRAAFSRLFQVTLSWRRFTSNHDPLP